MFFQLDKSFFKVCKIWKMIIEGSKSDIIRRYRLPKLCEIVKHTFTRYRTFFGDIFRSPSDVDTLGRASVLRDGTAFRPASAPHPLLLENHFYQPFIYPSETPAHPHTAPHTPTELEQELERARSEERSNCDLKESVAEGWPFFK